MPGPGGTYLPPVIAQLVADNDEFYAKISEAKAVLLKFSSTPTEVRLAADSVRLYRSLQQATAALYAFAKSVSNANLGANAEPFWRSIAELRAEMAAMSVDLKVDADVGAVFAKIEALRGALALTNPIMGGAASGKGAGGGESWGILGSLMAFRFAGGFRQTLDKILWGGGARLPLGIPGTGIGLGRLGIGGLAGMGSIGSFAGFGVEHIAMTIIGLIGSAIGGVLGGGALALGGLGTMGVGMGADMIVAGSTIGDTKLLAKAYENLHKAQAVYGAGSRQAAIAQAQLNYQIAALGGASKVGVAAEIQLAQAAMAFGETFDRVTQQARATFVNSLALPVLQMAQGYLPLLADAANRNFGIIGTAIKPLLSFLETDGHRIFGHLEDVFAKNLPTSVGIWVQSLELLLRTIEHIAMRADFGSTMKKILDYVTMLNTTGFDQLMRRVDNMINLFHVWSRFVGALGRDLALMFGQSAGLGSGIIQSLTVMLNKLGEWEKSTQGKAAMHTLFEAHKQEILTLLQLIPPLVVSIGRIYLAVAPTMVRVATVLAGVLVGVLNFVTGLQGGAGVFASWTLGVGLLLAKLHLLGPAFQLIGAAGPLAIKAIIGSFGLLRAAVGLVGLGPVAIAILALIVIGYLLVTHWTQIKAAAMAVWGWLKPYVTAALTAVTGAIKSFVAEAKKWWNQHKDEIMQVWNVIAPWLKAIVSGITKYIKIEFQVLATAIKVVWDIITTVIKIAWTVIKTTFTVFLDLITGHWKRAWNDLLAGARSIFKTIIGAIKGLIGDILAPFGDLPGKLLKVGKAIIQGLIDGIKQMAAGAVKAVQDVVSNIKSIPIIGKLMGSPSPFFTEVGKAIPQGVALGVIAATALAVSAVDKMTKQVRDAGKLQSSQPIAVAAQSIARAVAPSGGPSVSGYSGRASGAGASGHSTTVNIHSRPNITITGVEGNPHQMSLAFQKALEKQTTDLLKALKGGVYLPGQGLPA